MRFKNRYGNTLLMLLISLSISGIMMAGMMSFFTNQLKSQKRLAQKYEMLDLKNSIMSTMAKSSNCTAQLLAVNAAVVKSENGYSPISLSNIKASDSATAVVLAQVGEQLPGSSTGLKISAIELQILGPDGGTTNGYQGQFVVSFDSATTIGSFMPISVSQKVIASGGSPNVITSCLSLDGGVLAGGGSGSTTDQIVGTKWMMPGPDGMPSQPVPCAVINPDLLPKTLDWKPTKCNSTLLYEQYYTRTCYTANTTFGDLSYQKLVSEYTGKNVLIKKAGTYYSAATQMVTVGENTTMCERNPIAISEALCPQGSISETTFNTSNGGPCP